MRPILAEIHSLFQYFKLTKEDPASLRPDTCPHCGKKNPRCHGHYGRKSDRENSGVNNLNPIWIFRFYCPGCKHTCSVLPECIPPRRWYLWTIQQMALILCFSGISFRQISQQLKPSRWTISRWVKRLKEQFRRHTTHLKSKFSWLGYSSDIIQFWQMCLSRMLLSTAMMLLNNFGIAIP